MLLRQVCVLSASAALAALSACASAPTLGDGAHDCAAAAGAPDPRGKVFRVEEARCDLDGFAVAVRGEGRFQDLYTDKPIDADKAIDPVIERLKGEAGAHFARVNAQGTKEPLRILIYAHGGMVSKPQAVDHGEDLAPAMMRDGYAPVFLIWESSFVSAYGEHLCCVRDGLADRRYAALWAPARLFGDVASSAARAPLTLGSQLLRYGESVIGADHEEFYLAENEAEKACANVGPVAAPGHRPCPSMTIPTGTSTERNGDRRGAQLRSFATAPLFPARTAAGILGPEVGASAWDTMVRRTRTAFQRSKLLAPSDPADCKTQDDPRGEAGFAIFFERLACEIEFAEGKSLMKLASGEKAPVEVHFYGHSMGALIGNEALATQPQLPWREVVYMAAASPVRDFRATAAEVIAANEATSFRNLSLHPLAEAREAFGYGVAPHGSLLEWIDEMFERPRSADERTLGKWSNARRTVHLLPEGLRARSTFRVFPVQRKLRGEECAPERSGEPFKRCHPIVHGEFDDYSFWRPAYWEGAAASAPR